jgi:hypothetical protein
VTARASAATPSAPSSIPAGSAPTAAVSLGAAGTSLGASSSALPAPTADGGRGASPVLAPLAPRPQPATPATQDAVLGSPLLPALVAAAVASQRTGTVRTAAEPAAVAAPHATAAGRRTAVAAGGAAALLVLAALGVAAVARSSGWLAVGLELARGNLSFAAGHCPRWIPFTRGTTPAPAVPPDAAPPPGAAAVAEHGAPAAGRPGAVPAPPEVPTVPHLGGILGAGVSRSRPWELLKLVALALLGAANAVLVALRWRVARLQDR